MYIYGKMGRKNVLLVFPAMLQYKIHIFVVCSGLRALIKVHPVGSLTVKIWIYNLNTTLEKGE